MRRSRAYIAAQTLGPYGESATRLSCDPNVEFKPGQLVLANLPGLDQSLRVALFPIRIVDGGIIVNLPNHLTCGIGDPIDLLGPIGHGFSPPKTAKRWLLVAKGTSASRLMPLVDLGTQRGVMMSLWVDAAPPKLPPQVEVLPDLHEALRWTDYLAMDVSPEGLGTIREQLSLSSEIKWPSEAQVLLNVEYPCGLGVCQACAVKANRGWRLACVKGPVFELQTLGM
jgi:hypothetical protein